LCPCAVFSPVKFSALLNHMRFPPFRVFFLWILFSFFCVHSDFRSFAGFMVMDFVFARCIFLFLHFRCLLEHLDSLLFPVSPNLSLNKSIHLISVQNFEVLGYGRFQWLSESILLTRVHSAMGFLSCLNSSLAWFLYRALWIRCYPSGSYGLRFDKIMWHAILLQAWLAQREKMTILWQRKQVKERISASLFFSSFCRRWRRWLSKRSKSFLYARLILKTGFFSARSTA
jgi:hypothetical protein